MKNVDHICYRQKLRWLQDNILLLSSATEKLHKKYFVSRIFEGFFIIYRKNYNECICTGIGKGP